MADDSISQPLTYKPFTSLSQIHIYSKQHHSETLELTINPEGCRSFDLLITIPVTKAFIVVRRKGVSRFAQKLTLRPYPES